MTKLKFSADDVLNLLRQRHFNDVFVSECKNGPTHYSSHLRRLDAWVMQRSWKHDDIFGYEIKVNRQDFLKDEKWRDYLSMCNCFFFVTTPGVANRDEIPEEAGWIETSKNCKRLFMRKKAPSRDIKIDEDVFRYILMARSIISGHDIEDRRTRSIEHWKQWLKQNENATDIGYEISSKIAKMYRSIKLENTKLRSDIEKYEKVKEIMKDLGVDEVGYWNLKSEVQSKISKLIPEDLNVKIENTISTLTLFKTDIENFNSDE